MSVNRNFDSDEPMSAGFSERREVARLTKLLINESRLCQEREMRIKSLEHQLKLGQDQDVRANNVEADQMHYDMIQMQKRYRETVAELDMVRADLSSVQEKLQLAEQSRLAMQVELKEVREQLQSERSRSVSGVNLSQALLETQRTLDTASRTKSALRARIESLQQQQVCAALLPSMHLL